MNTDVFPNGQLAHRRAAIRPLAHSAIAGLAAAALVLGVAPTANADALTDQQARLRQELAQSSANVHEFEDELDQASAELQQSKVALDGARAVLAQAQQVRAQAQAEDDRLAGEVAKARAALAEAQRKVAENQRALDAEVALIGASVRETHQQNTELLGLAAFTQAAGGTGDVNEHVQWSTTIFNSTQAQMDRLTELQLKLQDAQQAAEGAKQAVEARKQAAAAQLMRTQAAEAAADDAAASVGEMVAANEQASAAAAQKLDTEKSRQQALDADNKAVAKRIAQRIAAQKAAADRARKKAEAERRARAAAAAKIKAEAARLAREAAVAKARRAADATAKAQAASRAAARAATAASKVETTSASSTQAAASSYFNYPVNAPITSSYGQRFHPVLHYWKLHDGTDFGASCGAAMRAPRAGVVTEAYYNAGYGNRLMIDHGLVGGHYLTTGYNHAIRYVVSPGQHVSAGQVIGYVGTTGYSTGCHLHLMVWQDGSVVNPMNWF